MDRTVNAVREFIQTTITRIIGLVFVLVGLLLVLATLVPTDVEALVIFGVGALCIALGGYALLNPENVYTPIGEPHYGDHSTGGRNRR